MKKNITKFLSFSIITLIFYVLIKTLFDNFDELSQNQIKLVYWKFIFSLIFILLSYAITPWMWCIILKDLNINLSYRKSFEIQFISGIGKYIPGKIWTPVAQVYMAKREKIPIKITLLSNIILLIINSLGSIYVFLISFILWDGYNLYFKLFIFLFVIIITLRMNLLEKLINFILKNFFKKDIILQLRYNNIFSLSIILFSSWLMAGVGYYFMINSFFSIDIKDCIIIVGIYAISWLIGYYAIIFPGGLGISEGVQVYLLSKFFPLSISIIIALVWRLWVTLSECIISCIALISIRYRKGALAKIG